MDVFRPGPRKNNECQHGKGTATAGGSLLGRTNTEDIKNMIIEGFCGRFTSTNDTNIRIIYMVRGLGIVGEKEESQNTLNVTWTPPTYLEKYTKEILIIIRKTQTIKSLGDIKVEITRDSSSSNWRRTR